MGDAILRIPLDARVRAYRTRDTYDGVVPATSRRQLYCHSSYIELSGLMGDAILRIPRDARVRAYRTRDTYDGVVPATSKRQPYCHSSYIELSGYNSNKQNDPIDDAFRGRHALASLPAGI